MAIARNGCVCRTFEKSRRRYLPAFNHHLEVVKRFETTDVGYFRAFEFSRRRENLPFSHHVEVCRRRYNLSFEHHKEVAALDPDEADSLLDWCELPLKNGRKKVERLVGNGIHGFQTRNGETPRFSFFLSARKNREKPPRETPAVAHPNIEQRRQTVATLQRFQVRFDDRIISQLCREFGCTKVAIKNDLRSVAANRELQFRIERLCQRPGAPS